MNAARETAVTEDLPRFAVDIPEDMPADSLAPAACFPEGGYQDYWLEVGFGNGEHLAAQAAAHPGTGLIGCEPFINGVAALLTSMAKEKIENIRIWPDDARFLLDALQSGSLSKIFLLHPDPWPKKRHHKRRFIQTETLDAFARLLRKGGELRIATDDADLANWMLSKTWSHPAFDFQADCADDWRQRPDDWPETRYGQKQLAGQPVYFRFLRV